MIINKHLLPHLQQHHQRRHIVAGAQANGNVHQLPLFFPAQDLAHHAGQGGARGGVSEGRNGIQRQLPVRQGQLPRERHAPRCMDALEGLVHVPWQLKLALQQGEQGGEARGSKEHGGCGQAVRNVIEGGLS